MRSNRSRSLLFGIVSQGLIALLIASAWFTKLRGTEALWRHGAGQTLFTAASVLDDPSEARNVKAEILRAMDGRNVINGEQLGRLLAALEAKVAATHSATNGK